MLATSFLLQRARKRHYARCGRIRAYAIADVAKFYGGYCSSIHCLNLSTCSCGQGLPGGMSPSETLR